MSSLDLSVQDLAVEIRTLRTRLESAEETIRAIRSNEVDAFVVGQSGRERICSLSGSDECYRAFVEVMGQGALTVAADGSILYCNRCFATLAGRPVESLLGSSIFDLVSSNDEPLLRAMIWEALSAPAARRHFMLYPPGRQPLPAEWIATPLTSEGANIVCLLVADLTERDARLAAEAANLAKDRFLASLSHELRTPLTPVAMAIAQMEHDPALSQEMRDDLGMIRRNLDLQTRLIDDLLDLSRATSGKLRIVPQVVSLHGLIRSVLDLLRSDLADSDFLVQCDLAAAADSVRVDPARIQQVLWNLLKNAIKFRGTSRQATLRTFNHDREIIVELRDHGIGMDPDLLSRMFNPFEQGDHSTGTRSGGLGLGLAIAKTLVDAHAGTLRAHSDGPGLGATFTLTLTLASADSPLLGPATVVAPAAPSSLQILLVEDHHDTAVALQKVLQSMGHCVTHAESVAAALSAAGSNRFDILISDIGLPDGTGYDLLQGIRQRYNVPGIALTGYGQDEDLRQSSAAGFDQHLTKPVDIAQLQQLIDNVSRRKN